MPSSSGKDVFKHLDPKIRKLLLGQGIKSPTPAQAAGILPILQGKTTLIIAPTGIGKTEAAVLPILDNVLKVKGPGIKVLYITPLRALNRDMLRRFSSWGEDLGLDVAVRHGDTSQKERARQSKNAPDFLITTPETLQVLFTGKRLIKHLENVRYVVIDEIHELAPNERGAQLSVALERLETLTKQPVQRVGLSATVGNPKEVASFLAGVGRDHKIVTVGSNKKPILDLVVPDITNEDDLLGNELAVGPEQASSVRTCKELIEAHRSTLLFVNTRDTAEAFGALFRKWHPDFPLTVHHGSLSMEARVEAEEAFKAAELKALVATSSLELGIDVGHTDFILHYNSPRTVSRLVQRVGRSGHTFKGTPQGTIIASDPDEILESLVIIDHSLKGQVEVAGVRAQPLNVLANQIMAMTLAKTEKPILHQSYETIKKAYPFRDLTYHRFSKVVEYLSSIRALWMDSGTISKGRKTINYFYDNISMITDEKKYLVRDITTRKPVANLDESFVVTLEPFSKFIVKGRSWYLVEVGEDEVLVQPCPDLGSLPSWVGEDIPVPFEVAQDVGRLRRKKPRTLPKVVKDYLKKQEKESVIPTDKLVTIERTMEFIVINGCFGSKVNETLGRYLSAMLATGLGGLVGLTTDPYRIMIEMPRTPKADRIQELLMGLDPDNLDSLIRIVIKNSSHLKWSMVRVGKKFGAIRKDLDFREVNMDRLLESLQETVVLEEAIDKVVWEDMDIASTKRVLQALQSGGIELKEAALSPIGMAGLKSRKEVLFPKKADRTILLAMKRRLVETDVRLTCLSCGGNRRVQISRMPEHVTCHKCGSVMVAVLHMGDKTSLELIQKVIRSTRNAASKAQKEAEKVTKKGKRKRPPRLTASSNIPKGKTKDYKRLQTNADLVREYGPRAAMALVARGIGPTNAGRILARQYTTFSEEEELDFLRDILEAEVTYARTKRFWD